MKRSTDLAIVTVIADGKEYTYGVRNLKWEDGMCLDPVPFCLESWFMADGVIFNAQVKDALDKAASSGGDSGGAHPQGQAP